MTELKEPITIYAYDKNGYSFEIGCDREDELYLYPWNRRRGIRKDKIITDKANQKFYYGNRYFISEKLMSEIIHEEVETNLSVAASPEEVAAFWKEWSANHPDF